jgi:hypothetical protein
LTRINSEHSLFKGDSEMVFRLLGRTIGNTVLYPVDQPFPKTPADYGIDYKNVEFQPEMASDSPVGYSMKRRAKSSS